MLTVVGTRPEIIRLSRVIALLDQTCNHTLVHTGQNYDANLRDIFFSDLSLRDPDYYLDVDTTTIGHMLGESFQRLGDVLSDVTPDVLLVLGDTNSALCALVAKRMKIPVFHMEAGNRCFDMNVPEETNRKIVDHFADVNLVYSEHARRNLLAEGLHSQRIYHTGSPLREVLDFYSESISKSTILSDLQLQESRYFVLSLHREENVDNPARLLGILEGIQAVADQYQLPVIATTHPRTKKQLEMLKWNQPNDRIQFHQPFGYNDYVSLQKSSRCTISDSGTISEESAILGFPAVTPRDSIERPEALDTGSIILAGCTRKGIEDSVTTVLDSWDRGVRPPCPADYEVTNCSERVVNLIVGTSRLLPIWDGLRIDQP
ncbi:MAG: UDP-N-acetylglucosamine 2-epimerase (non-hydrolyzing) [Verrucomicrobiota bacterium]